MFAGVKYELVEQHFTLFDGCAHQLIESMKKSSGINLKSIIIYVFEVCFRHAKKTRSPIFHRFLFTEIFQKLN